MFSVDYWGNFILISYQITDIVFFLNSVKFNLVVSFLDSTFYAGLVKETASFSLSLYVLSSRVILCCLYWYILYMYYLMYLCVVLCIHVCIHYTSHIFIYTDLLCFHYKRLNHTKKRGWLDGIADNICAEFYLNIACKP